MIAFVRHLSVLTVLTLLPFSIVHAQASSELKVQDVLERYYAANGGLENILSIRSLRAEGTVHRSGGESGMLLLLKKRPNRQFTSIVMDDGRTIKRGSDGQESWLAIEQRGLPTYIETGVDAGETRFDSMLIAPEAEGISLRLLEPVREGRELLYPVEAVDKAGKTTTIYLEARSLREVRRVERWEQDGAAQERVVELSQHSKVNNVWFAKRQVSRMAGDETVVTFDAITVNPGIFDDAFRAPRN